MKIWKKIHDYFFIPPSAKLELSRKNVKRLSVAAVFLLFLGILGFLVDHFYHHNWKANFGYYMLFVGASLGFLIAARITRGKDGFYLNQILVTLPCICVCLLMYYNLSGEINISYVLCFYFAIVVMIVALEMTPLFYTTAIILGYIEMVHFTKQFDDESIQIFININNALFCMALLFFGFYKRRLISVQEQNKLEIEEQIRKLSMQNYRLNSMRDNLLIDKQYLESEVFNQSLELQQQKEHIIKRQDSTIVSLSNLVENRDEDVNDHVLRVRDFVQMIAAKARQTGNYPELSERVIKLYAKAAPMHDIGKIVVPDDVLKKPGKLTPEEFEQMKLHTTKGGKIVEDILGADEDEDYIQIAKEVATFHHERYDGTGYPYGLKGEDIPLSARIMALAAVFDALVAPRVYKEPTPVEEAFKIIEANAGTQLDPELAKVFLASKEEAVTILKKYQDI